MDFKSQKMHTFLSKIYVVNSDMKTVIGMSDTNVLFKGLGPFIQNGIRYTSEEHQMSSDHIIKVFKLVLIPRF